MPSPSSACRTLPTVGPVEVFEPDVVGRPQVLAQLDLCETHKCSVHGLGAHRLLAEAGAEVLTGARKGADPDQIQLISIVSTTSRGSNRPMPPAPKAPSGNQ